MANSYLLAFLAALLLVSATADVTTDEGSKLAAWFSSLVQVDSSQMSAPSPHAAAKPPTATAKPPTPMASPPSRSRLPPVRTLSDCVPLCQARCSRHSRLNRCMRACKTCCWRCKCVPPGTYGNREMCGTCYTQMKTHGGVPKCP